MYLNAAVVEGQNAIAKNQGDRIVVTANAGRNRPPDDAITGAIGKFADPGQPSIVFAGPGVPHDLDSSGRTRHMSLNLTPEEFLILVGSVASALTFVLSIAPRG
jgi:hypothetical protein